MATVLDEVPLVSMAEQANDPDGFAQKFGQSFRRFGFAMVADHGVPQELIDRAWAKTKEFFALSEEEKRQYHIPGGGGARGLTPFKTEIAKGATHVDLKEFWHIGRELAKGHRFEAAMAPNIWPERPEGFQGNLPRAVPGARRCRRPAALGDRSLSRARAALVRPRGEGRQFGAAPAPLSARRCRRPRSARRRA
jgi:hypothetical protein